VRRAEDFTTVDFTTKAQRLKGHEEGFSAQCAQPDSFVLFVSSW